jgi:hypothetical protein
MQSAFLMISDKTIETDAVPVPTKRLIGAEESSTGTIHLDLITLLLSFSAGFDVFQGVE